MGVNDKINVGLIGAGNIGNVHINGFKSNPDTEVVAVTDVYRPLAEARAREHGIAKVYDTAEELIADPSVDAVVIAVPNKYHAPLAVKALDAGKHVVCEKPMAIDVASAKEIVRAQKRSGKLLLVPHQMRWEWTSLQVREQVEKGALGRIYAGKVGQMRRKGIPGWGTWFTQKAESGGGPLIDIGVHYVDLALYLMGNPKPVSVFGATYAAFGPKRRGIGTWGKPNWDGFYDVEDLAMAMIRMEDGSTLTLDVSWAVHGDFEGNGPFLHLMGSEGGAAIRGKQVKFFLESFDRPLQTEVTQPDKDEGSRARMIRHFVECVREGKEPISNAMTGLANNLILEGIYESSQTGTAVTLNWEI